MRDQDRKSRKGVGCSLQIQRVPQSNVKRAGQLEFPANPHAENAAVHKGGTAQLTGNLEDRHGLVTVQPEMVHGWKQADHLHSQLSQTSSGPLRSIRLRRVNHELTHKAHGKVPYCFADGILLAGKTGDQADPADPVFVQILNPPLGQFQIRAWLIPLQTLYHQAPEFGGIGHPCLSAQ